MLLSSRINKFIWTTIAGVLISLASFCQTNYPVQLSSNLIPPFSGYLADYGASSNENLSLIALFTDFTKPSYDVKLKLKLTGQGITIQSKSFYFSPAVHLEPGVPIQISGSEISNLFNSANLDFQGISRSDYEVRKILPEGYYQICITAYDFNNPTTIQVSNEACANGFIALSDPPYLNFPSCNSAQSVSTPQQIVFQWTPVSLASPNSAFNTEYEFSLYEVRPSTQNPNNIIQTLPPIFQERTNFTQLAYGIAEPPLQTGMQYVWRVRAIDLSGRDLFKNNGYSQVCTFTYGSIYSSLDSNATKLKLNVQALTHRLAGARWDSLSMFSSYRLEFKKKNASNWFATPTPFAQSRITDLEPNTEYEARVRGITNEFTGSWSDVKNFKTPEKPVIVCGQGGVGASMANFIPLKNAQNFMIWEVGQFDMVITQLSNYQSLTGTYSGKGKIQLPFLNINVATTFQNVKVNDMMQVVQGKVDVVTEGIGNWLNNNPQNFIYDSTFILNANVDTIYINPSGQIVIIHEGGGSTTIGSTGYQGGLLITDNQGNQWVVNPNGTISPVPPGSMLPSSSEPLTEDEMIIIKLAMKSVREEYTESKIATLKSSMTSAESSFDVHINSQKLSAGTNTSSLGDEEILGISFNPLTTADEAKIPSVVKNFKEKELKYIQANILFIFSKEINTRDELTYIGQCLTVESIPFVDYVKKELLAGKSKQAIAGDVKTKGILPLSEIVAKKKLNKP